MNKPFIKLLQRGEHYYFYDVNYNKLVKISHQSYNILNNILKSDKPHIHRLNDECKEYFKKGFLKPNKIKTIAQDKKRKELIKLLDSDLHSLLLQVTRDCNLKCNYCFYSGKYENIRTHEKEYMNLNMSKKIVDYFFQRTRPERTVNVGFYGGEPLLNFDLIQNTVKYIIKTYPNKKTQFSITTNAILLSPEVWEFLEEHNFLTTISLDGPQKIHDANRVFANGKGSFDIIFKNILYGFENHVEYYKSNIKFNAVITRDRNIVENFFNNTPILRIASKKLSEINNYHKNTVKTETYDNFEYKKTNDIRKIRTLVNYLKSDNNTQSGYNIRIKSTVDKLNSNSTYPLTNAISAGTCIPGVSRLFATFRGDFFMCEKVDDNSEELKIGDVFDGWNEKNIMKLANISNESTECGCKNCWAIRLCNMCAAKICALDSKSLNLKCDEIRKAIEIDLIDICILHEIKKEKTIK